jgi:uncharacterized protein
VNIAITGASGFIGSALGRAMEAEGATVLRLVRREPRGRDEVCWSPDAPFDATPMEGCDALIHLAGEGVADSRWTAAKMARIRESRVGATRHLCDTLLRLHAPPRRFLCASAIGYYGDRGDERLDESSLPGTGFLSDVCRAWEDASAAVEAAGCERVRVRIGVVLGAEGGALAKMLPIFRLGLGGRLGTGAQWMSWIGLGDAVAALRFLLHAPGASGVYNLTAPAPCRQGEFARALGRALRRPAVLPTPAWALRAALGGAADEVLLAGARIQPRRLLDAGFAFQTPELPEALRVALAPVSTNA